MPSDREPPAAPPAPLERDHGAHDGAHGAHGPAQREGARAAGELERVATCSCGRLRITCVGEPVRVSLCHCIACQKRTGSVFGAQARFPAERVRVEGDSSQFERTSDEGNAVVFHFCPTCASVVHFVLGALPGFVVVPVGAFADRSFPAPTVSIYEARKHPWLELLGVEHHD